MKSVQFLDSRLRKIRVMFTINTENLGNALDYASVGGGKGYVLLVDPTIRELGNGRTMQLASVCSSDGDRIGTANIEVRTKDMKKPEIFYISATLKQAVASLAPVAAHYFCNTDGFLPEIGG